MPNRLIGTLILAAAVSVYFVYSRLVTPNGDQKVSYAPSRKECFSEQSSRPWRYCVHVPANGKVNGEIGYLLHGRNLDENSWNDDTFYTAMVQQYWTEHGLVPPTVVVVSFGPEWILAPRGQSAASGLLDVFTDEVIPTVEKRVGRPAGRLVFGESMGGLNSLILGMSKGAAFRKVAALCPGVYRLSPYAPLAEIQSFMRRTGADPKLIFGIIRFSRKFAADEAEWKRISPVELLEKVEPKRAPRIYLSGGLYDAYGNFEGNQFLARRAAERGVPLTWRPLYGGHCAIDIPSLAEFLVN